MIKDKCNLDKKISISLSEIDNYIDDCNNL